MCHRRPNCILPAGLVVILALVLSSRPASAQLGEPVKPYIVFIMDVSGSMDAETGSGPPSCGGVDTRFDHAKCAVANITNSYGDVVLALARFRETSTVTTCANGCDDGEEIFGAACSACNETTGAGCTATMSSSDRFEILVPLVDENQDDIIEWVDFQCGTCTTDQSDDPELAMAGWTPIAGSLKGAKRYFQGLDSETLGPYWTGAGDDPIRDDPLKDIFPVVGGPQCRPYIVVQLTDGEETCTIFSNTEAAAAAMLITDVDGTNYRIETKPIGFGRTPGDTQIEGIAHAGGAPDVGGVWEGYYAQNETDISTAMAQIIQDALKFEVCNDLDDDCDTLVDEDFPLKGTICDDGELGICLDEGTYICNASEDGVECYIDPAGTTDPDDFEEVCNGLDDDCDGEIDEAPLDCSGCIGFEICDGKDNDCDGDIDEGITRICGTNVGICVEGTQDCVELTVEAPSGTWTDCGGTYVGPDPLGEQCNNLDDDCNGAIDGLIEECTVMPDPPGNPDVGICHPGIRVCPAVGLWGDCLDEVVPEDDDPCDGLNNDCDGEVDEDFVPEDCSTDCGTGSTECVDGVIECSSDAVPIPEACNGIDDDCDTIVDNGPPFTNEPADYDCYDGGLCLPGTLTCLGGDWVCVGGEMPGIEICDCEDNDCDVDIDEGDICPEGATCIHCQCAYPCATNEFPCPIGRVCVDDYCILDTCYQVTCLPTEEGNQTECVDGDCVESCALVTCPEGFVCRGSDGTCQTDDCHAFPDKCEEDEMCVAGECVTNPCFGVTCPDEGDYCLDGECVGSCAGVTCPDGEECVLGDCQPLPCGGSCEDDQVCIDNTCVDDPCDGVTCEQGQVCDPQTGDCITDPCLNVTCPEADQVCVNGTCQDPINVEPDAGPPPDHTYVAPGGGGGCAVSEGSAGSSSALLILFAMFFAALRRREDQ